MPMYLANSCQQKVRRPLPKKKLSDAVEKIQITQRQSSRTNGQPQEESMGRGRGVGVKK